MARRSLWRLALPLAIVAVATLVSSCYYRRVYYQFHPVSVAGWQNSDTLHFILPELSGQFTLTVYARTTNLYPYRNLSLRVMDGDSTIDASLVLADKKGKSKGQKGIGATEVKLVAGRVNLNQKRNRELLVVHNMRRELLPGISDVGISLDR